MVAYDQVKGEKTPWSVPDQDVVRSKAKNGGRA